VGIAAPSGAANAERQLRPGVLELSGDSPAAAGKRQLIGAKEAIRRVLVLENPRCADSHRLPHRCTPDCS
jgi:gentisate 1,2-dioxygenase